MTAQEARELSFSNKISFEKIKRRIKMMAEEGLNYTAFDKEKIADVEQVKTYLVQDGYEVNETACHLTVKW